METALVTKISDPAC